MDELKCTHCGSTSFDKNPYFLECCECGTRFIYNADGHLQRTTAFGVGEGSSSRGSSSTYDGYDDVSGHVDSYAYGGPQVVNNYYVNSGNVNSSIGYNVGGAPLKRKLVALLLCIFLGPLGIHYFYVGKIIPGLACLLFLPTGITTVIWVVDIVRIALGIFKDKYGNILV